MPKQVHIYFSGSVQGVGFRYTARRIAQRWGVAGWIRNLADGRVEMRAQAEETTLGQFLNAVREQFPGYITDEESSWEDASCEFTEFTIRF